MLENVSIVLTVYNEGKGVLRVLRYLDSMARYFDELIIVSDACKDDTDRLIKAWFDNGRRPFKIIVSFRKHRYGRANAIRHGLAQTKNDLVVFFAGDIQPFPLSLPNILAYFQDQRVGAVSGHPTLLNGDETLADNLSRLMWESHDRVGELTSKQGTFFHLNGEIYAIRKHLLQGFEDYDSIAEDCMIGYLIFKTGYRVLWAKNVTYYMMYPRSLGDWLNIRKRCCFGRIDFAKKNLIPDYPFYELSHSEYLVNILKIAFMSWKRLLALPLGAFIEIICRIYYTITYDACNKDLLNRLWQPSIETKW